MGRLPTKRPTLTNKITKTAGAANTAAGTAPVVRAKRRRAKRAEVAPTTRVAVATKSASRTPQATPQLAALEPAMPARVTRCDQIIAMLNGANGTSIAELMAATGWLPHAARSALSGLRKAGMLLERTSEDGGSRYRIKVAA
jgi:hypothetical protein